MTKARILTALCAMLVALACENETTSRIQSGADDGAPPESLTIGTPATAPEALAGEDVDFVMKAARADLHEVHAGRLGAERASDERVKEFARRMIQDHGKSSQELSTIAQSKNVGIPLDVGPHAADMQKTLSGLTGSEFDREYMTAMVEDHTKAVEMMRSAVATTKNPEVKDFASRTLPVIEEHLRAAKEIASSLGKT